MSRLSEKARAKEGANAALSAQRAAHEDKSAEQLLRETARGAQRMGLPVLWSNAAGQQLRSSASVRLAAPTKTELENFAQPPRRTCGLCRFFNLHQGRKEIVKQRFAERMVHDERWRAHHLGTSFQDLGLCDASNGELATSTVANADNCDQFRPKSRLF